MEIIIQRHISRIRIRKESAFLCCEGFSHKGVDKEETKQSLLPNIC